jgi:hypothetical protein
MIRKVARLTARRARWEEKPRLKGITGSDAIARLPFVLHGN